MKTPFNVLDFLDRAEGSTATASGSSTSRTSRPTAGAR